MTSALDPPIATIASTAYVVVWTLTALALLVVCLRMYARIGMKDSQMEKDDWVMALGMLVTLTASGSFTAAVYAIAQGDTQDLSHTLHLNLTAAAVNILAISIPKLSVAFFLLRVFRLKRWEKILLIVLALLMLVFGILGIIIEFAQCTPAASQWNPQAFPKHSCWSPHVQINYSLFVGSYSSCLDCFYAIYPINRVMALQMTARKKLVVVSLLGLGIISGCFAAYKTSLIPNLIARDASLAKLNYESIRITMWTNIEAAIIIIAASLPTINSTCIKLVASVKLRLGSWSTRLSNQSSRERSGLKPNLESNSSDHVVSVDLNEVLQDSLPMGGKEASAYVNDRC